MVLGDIGRIVIQNRARPYIENAHDLDERVKKVSLRNDVLIVTTDTKTYRFHSEYPMPQPKEHKEEL